MISHLDQQFLNILVHSRIVIVDVNSNAAIYCGPSKYTLEPIHVSACAGVYLTELTLTRMYTLIIKLISAGLFGRGRRWES